MALRNQPYIPLYVMDFMTDQKVQNCSANAIGVYLFTMFLMHKSDTYGKLLLKQKRKQNIEQTQKQNIEQMFKQKYEHVPQFCLEFAWEFVFCFGKILPFDIEETFNGMAELLDENILYVEDNYLIQKRMVRDNEISGKRALAGKRGGDKNKVKNVENEEEILLKQNSKQNESKTLNMNMNIYSSLPDKDLKGVTGEIFVSPFLTKRMAEIFYMYNPNDMPDDSEDLKSCLTISQKIEIAKHWGKGSSLNGKMEDTISEWEKILDHIQTKEFFKRFSLKNISSQFQAVWKSYVSENQTKESFKTNVSKKDKSIRGVSVSEDFSILTLSDGSTLALFPEDISWLKDGRATPNDFFKGWYEDRQ